MVGRDDWCLGLQPQSKYMVCLCVFVCVLSSRCLVCRPSHFISIQRQKCARLLSVIKHLALAKASSKSLCCPKLAGRAARHTCGVVGRHRCYAAAAVPRCTRPARWHGRLRSRVEVGLVLTQLCASCVGEHSQHMTSRGCTEPHAIYGQSPTAAAHSRTAPRTRLRFGRRAQAHTAVPPQCGPPSPPAQPACLPRAYPAPPI